MLLLGRLIIIVLVVFEFLNLVGVLNFTLEFSWLGLLVTSIGAFAALELIYFLYRRKNLLLSPFPYLLAGLGLWLDALGDVMRFYGRFLWYDQFMHIVGGGIVASAALAVFLKMRERLFIPVFIIVILAVSLTSFIGDLYEIEEYLEDKFWHGRQVRLGDGPDTADDLLWNIIGGVGVVAAYLLFSINKRAAG